MKYDQLLRVTECRKHEQLKKTNAKQADRLYRNWIEEICNNAQVKRKRSKVENL